MSQAHPADWKSTDISSVRVCGCKDNKLFLIRQRRHANNTRKIILPHLIFEPRIERIKRISTNKASMTSPTTLRDGKYAPLHVAEKPVCQSVSIRQIEWEKMSTQSENYTHLHKSKKKHTFVELKIIRLTTRLIIYSHHILIWTP